MTSRDPPPAGTGGTGPTRRAVLGGIGTLGLSVVGSMASPGRARSLGGTSGVGSARTAPSDAESLESFVDGVMSERMGNEIPGAIVAMVVGDEPVLTKGYGHADVENDVPARADETAFRVGSVGKLVTWTAVMQCVEDGTLDLDEDVNTYLEESAVEVADTYAEPVTLRHLGTHTAGFDSTLDPELVTDPANLESLETLLAERQPDRVRPPGELVGYSNYGAALAGHVVAEVQDTTFEEYVQSEIFEPLGMTHSTFAQPVPAGHPGELAAGHTRDGGTFRVADDVYINMRPAGSMSATASDMAAFMSAHLGDGSVGGTRILGEETVRSMHDVHHVRHPAVTNWRYGFHEYGHPDANLLSHSGGTVNLTSRLVLAPDHDVGIFVGYNVNASGERPAAVVDEIIAEYGLQPKPSEPTPTTVSGGQARAEAVAGEYSATYLPQGGPLQVVDLLARIRVRPAGEGRLVTETLDGERRRWVETEPYVFEEVGGHDVIAFEVDGDEVMAMNVSSEPTGVHRPVPLHERQVVAAGVLGSALSGFGLSLIGWGSLGVWRGLRGSKSATGESR